MSTSNKAATKATKEVKPLDIRTSFRGYLIEESDHDTTNLICRFGHVYVDGGKFVASITAGTRAQTMALRKLGTVVMDGDRGELSVAFEKKAFREVAKILKPRYARRTTSAA
jgi:hypothetical protein